jgi:hypothetical protein
MREKPIEVAAVEFAEARDWLVRKVAYVGRRSAPDRWFFRRGVLVIIEFKRQGQAATLQQTREHNRLRAHGFEVHVVDSLDQAKALLA